MGAGRAPQAGAVDEARVANEPAPDSADVVRGREPFLKLKASWDAALLAGPDPTPALEHDFVRLWAESFAASKEPVVVTSRRAGKLTAALPIFLSSARVGGIPVRIAESIGDAHATRGGPLLGTDGLAALDAIVRRLADEPWDVLSLRDVPRENGVLDRLAQALADAGLATHVSNPMDSPYVPLPSSYAELESRLDSHLKQNLRRRRRRLEAQGPVTFEVVSSLDGLDRALEDAFDIEASGWKGREGSAIRARPQTVGFYAGWARALARSGALRLSFLKLGDERIAFQFGHVTRGRYYLPKTSYRESHRADSPGQLLTAEVMRRCIEEGLESFEFLGHAMDWKRDWTPLVRPHEQLWAFRRTPRARLAATIRFELRPRATAAWKLAEERLPILRTTLDRWSGR